TVQATLTRLILDKPFETLPMLAILPRGMTNMTAADIGISGKGSKGLLKLFDVVQRNDLESTIQKRRLLKLSNIKGYEPQIGMFFGTAGITRAIEVCRSSVHSMNFEAEIANGLTLAKLLFQWARSGGRDDSVLHGDNILVEIDGLKFEEKSYLLVLATTLEKLVLKSRPFWNCEPDGNDGHLHYTAISYPPRKLLRNALKILYGGKQRSLPPEDYRSQDAQRVTLRMNCAFTLDGQLFEPHAEDPLILSAEDQASFVRI
ncbi:MAG: hypothetical protein R3245_03860, partial [Kiloniellales bacterium]|nr:hypothetical protein [Kiloniellales bacterium]